MLSHNYIGTEHILLGLIHEGEGVAAKALESLSISLEAVRAQVEEIIGQGQQAPSGHIPFTPRAKKVLELQPARGLQLGHNYIGTEHILLGLIREGEGVAAQVLVRKPRRKFSMPSFFAWYTVIAWRASSDRARPRAPRARESTRLNGGITYAPATRCLTAASASCAIANAFGARGGTAADLRHALAILGGDAHAGDLVVEELGVAMRRERQDADHHRQAERRGVVEEALERARVVDRLGHHELGARGLLVLEAAQLALAIVRGRLGAGREHERRRLALLAGRDRRRAFRPAAIRSRPIESTS